MSRIKIEDIQSVLTESNWKLISTKYENLDSELIFECPHGHQVFSSWKKMKTKLKCPECETNEFLVTDTKIVPKAKGVNRVMALDQATHVTGWSIYDNGKLVKYGVFETTLESNIERYNQIKLWFKSMLMNWRPDFVGFEDIQFQEESEGRRMGVTVFQTLAQLQGVLMETCFEQKIKYELCPTNTWRHFCGVKGKARTDKKRSMQLIAQKLYGIKVSEDEADAIGIGYYLVNNVVKTIVVENWE